MSLHYITLHCMIPWSYMSLHCIALHYISLSYMRLHWITLFIVHCISLHLYSYIATGVEARILLHHAMIDTAQCNNRRVSYTPVHWLVFIFTIHITSLDIAKYIIRHDVWDISSHNMIQQLQWYYTIQYDLIQKTYNIYNMLSPVRHQTS